MALETGSYISALVATNPTASDPKSQGDDHLRFVKAKILETFPSVTGAVTPTHTELNYVDGVTSAIQTQLDAKAPIASPTFTGTVTIPSGASIAGFAPLASPTFTGTPAAPTAANGTNTTQLATTAFVQSTVISGAFTGTLAQLNAGITDADVASLDGTETLTNKTLTAPALGTPTSGNLSACTADGTNAVGFLHIPQNSKSAAYTLVLADAGKHILHPSADTTARIFTIPANSSVAFPIGTAVTVINQNAGGVITIAITTDTMRLAGAGTTGSRTLAANGVATAVKLTATEWIISGTNLT